MGLTGQFFCINKFVDDFTVETDVINWQRMRWNSSPNGGSFDKATEIQNGHGLHRRQGPLK